MNKHSDPFDDPDFLPPGAGGFGRGKLGAGKKKPCSGCAKRRAAARAGGKHLAQIVERSVAERIKEALRKVRGR